MCGINGFVSIENCPEQQLRHIVNKMNEKIVHRGPDDDGIYTFSKGNIALAMGMRRLSIIDLNSGKQPITSEDGQFVIVFNGEIYNYRELRSELLERGVVFKTQSDTEVILMLYKEYGTAGFKKLDGMFAFSIHDKTKNKVYITRDFFGEKPLYYGMHEGKFIWCSELKSLLDVADLAPPMDKMAFNLFFRLTYIPAPFTIYEGIKKLEANHYLEYDLEKHTWITEPILALDKIEQIDVSFDEAKTQVKQLVTQSVESRSVSDVPIGTFLSGGVDSSVVSLCLSQMNEAKINTFSIGFEKKSYDETDKSRMVANMIGSNHREFILDENDLKSNVSEIISNFDEPFADSSSLPSYLVAYQTSKHVKVALTGDGGDEVFGGYNKYYMGAINQKYTRYVPRPVHNAIQGVLNPLLNVKSDRRGRRFQLKRLLHSIDYSNNYYWDIISLGFPSNTLAEYVLPEILETTPFDYYKNKTKIGSPTCLSEYREIDRHISLEGDMLVKVDRTSMLTSLECRAPFLNKSLWDYTNKLPEEYLMKGWDKKYILKAAFAEDFPEGFLDKSKSGFGIPIGDWLRSSLRADLEACIDPLLLKTQHIFQVEAITKLVSDHLNGKDHTFMVWTFYCFQKWYQTNHFK